jgi:hypothetical protein
MVIDKNVATDELILFCQPTVAANYQFEARQFIVPLHSISRAVRQQIEPSDPRFRGAAGKNRLLRTQAGGSIMGIKHGNRSA